MNDLGALLKAAVGEAYRIERELGGGGMSRVFVAEEVALGRRVVIKVLPPEMSASVNADRFRREIQLAAQLQHPAIVPLLTAGSSPDLLWYVMPFVEGESLRGRIGRQGQLPLDEAARVWRDLLEALEFAHQRNVVHRDIKPENIMMSGRHAVAMDFGVAKAVSAATGVSGVTMAATQAGLAIGTPAYMAPEQAAGDPNLDGRTDLYAAGLVMYEMLAGKGPFEARTPSEMMAAHLAKAPTPLASVRGDVPPALAELVMQCLAKRPDERPAGATEVLQRLDGMTGQLSGARTPSATQSLAAAGRGSRARLVIAGVVGVVAVAGGWYGLKVRGQMAEAKAMAAVGLPDSARLGVAFIPVSSDASDSIVARNLSAAMEAVLQQDRRLYVVGDERVRAALQDAGMQGTSPSPDSARLLAREYGAHTYLVRTVARAGTGYVLSAEGRTSKRDSSLFQVQETAKDAAELPGASNRLALATRRGLQQVLGKLERPLPTGALFGTNAEAARLWIEAQAPFERRDYLASAALARRALQADSTFALAWTTLGAALGNFGINPSEEFLARRNAYVHRDRLRSVSTRLYAEAVYLRTIGDYPGALAAGRRGLDLADEARKGLFRNAIALTYQMMGKFDLTSPMFEEDHRASLAQPGLPSTNLVVSLLDEGRVADAQRIVAQLDSAAGATHPTALQARMSVAYGQRDVETILSISRQRLAAAKTDAARLTGLVGNQLGSALGGRVDSMAAAAAARRVLFAKSGNGAAQVNAAAQEALVRFEFLGDRTGSTKVLDDALAQVRWDTLPALDRSYPSVVAARAVLGDVAGARRMVTDWERGIPAEMRAAQAPLIASAKGDIALVEGKGDEALKAFREGAPRNCPGCAALNYARAFDALGNADSTIYWYEQYLTSSTSRLSALNARFAARAYKRLGELYEAKGDAQNAVKRYTDFTTLWKNADPKLQPAVQDAKARIAKLQAKAG